MIFTGVTGGEIISLLYPLFILSPFCYIIISKESLDGPSYNASGDGNFPPLVPNEAAANGCRRTGSCGNGRLLPVYRRAGVHGQSLPDVRHHAGGADAQDEL